MHEEVRTLLWAEAFEMNEALAKGNNGIKQSEGTSHQAPLTTA